MSPAEEDAHLVKKPVFFPNLDGWRFVAFLAVFLAHGFRTSAERMEPGVLRTVLFESGGLGVSFFFVLSGFLITYLVLEEIQRHGRLNVWKFYMRRILRIWPLYYFVILYAFWIGPLLIFLGNQMKSDGVNGLWEKSALAAIGLLGCQGPGDWRYYACFLSNFEVIRVLSEDAGLMITDITWSLAVEEQFYLIWPIVFRFLPKSGYPWFFGSLILSSLIFRIVHANELHVVSFHTMSCIGDLALGGAAAWLSFQAPRFRAFFEGMPQSRILAAYGAGLALIALRNAFGADPLLAVAFHSLHTLFFAFILLEQNYGRNSFGKMSRFAAFSRLGIYTYGFYLLHPIGIMLVVRWLRMLGIPSELWYVDCFSGLVALGVTCVIGWVSYRYWETPFLKLKDRWKNTRQLSAPVRRSVP